MPPRLRLRPNLAASRDRMAAPKMVHLEPAPESCLARLLMFLFAWGWVSLPFVQRIAMAAVRDIQVAKATKCSFDDLDFLANMGTKGLFPANMYRDLMKNHIEPTGFSPPGSFYLPLKVGPTDIRRVHQAIILPHVWFADMYHNHPDAFKSRVAPGEASLERWWHDMESHPIMRSNPFEGRPEYRQRCIPIRIHGDAVPVVGTGKVWQKMMDVYSWTRSRARTI
jgi:hypothetical protein